MNWAYCWRTKRRTEQEQQYLTIDPHSPPEFRANIVRNLDEFHEVFETTTGRRAVARPGGPGADLVAGGTIAAHRQSTHPIRFEWGPTGAAAVADEGAVAVVVDVLSFTTTLSVAVDAGIAVYPFGWWTSGPRRTPPSATRCSPGVDPCAPESACRRSRCAPRRGSSGWCCPLPNGSAISFALAGSGASVVGACLRNATATARWLSARRTPVAVVAAGERWSDGTLRPAVEDLWGAGAVIAGLVDLGATGLSPEARMAELAYRVGRRPARRRAACERQRARARGRRLRRRRRDRGRARHQRDGRGARATTPSWRRPTSQRSACTGPCTQPRRHGTPWGTRPRDLPATPRIRAGNRQERPCERQIRRRRDSCGGAGPASARRW